MCDECAILRDHYPRDPEVRLGRVRLFFPSCIYCGARYLQWIARARSDRPKHARDEVYARIKERWVAHGHDYAEMRKLAMARQWAVAPDDRKVKA